LHNRIPPSTPDRGVLTQIEVFLAQKVRGGGLPRHLEVFSRFTVGGKRMQHAFTRYMTAKEGQNKEIKEQF